MLLLVLGVQFSIVGHFGCEHSEKDFQQSLAQASESACVTHPLSAFLLKVNRASRVDAYALTDRQTPHGTGNALGYVAVS